MLTLIVFTVLAYQPIAEPTIAPSTPITDGPPASVVPVQGKRRHPVTPDPLPTPPEPSPSPAPPIPAPPPPDPTRPEPHPQPSKPDHTPPAPVDPVIPDPAPQPDEPMPESQVSTWLNYTLYSLLGTAMLCTAVYFSYKRTKNHV